MATRNFVPRATGEGGIGTAAKKWALGWINALIVATLNALTLTAQVIGFTISGGTTSKALTVSADTTLDEAVAMSAKLTTPGAWTPYTPTITSGSGTFTSVVGSGRWVQIGKTVHLKIFVDITTNGTAGSPVIATLPVAPIDNANLQTLHGRENNITGKMLQGIVVVAGSIVNIQNYDNSYAGGDSYKLYLSGAYEAA